MLNLTLLGTGGGMPMPYRHLSSLLISYQGRKILLDCGEGTQVAMRKMNTGFKSIDIICISHFHGDHIFGLPGLLSTIGNSERVEPIIISGPKGLGSVVKGLLVATNLPYDIHLIENPVNSIGFNISNNRLTIDENNKIKEIIINTIDLEHSTDCLGYSIYLSRRPKFIVEKAQLNNVPKEMWGKLQSGETIIYNNKTYEPEMVLGEERKGIKLSYITDTRPTDSIIDFIDSSDLFICEGTYGDDNDLEKAINNKHMTYSEAALLAKKGNVKELLLTHFGSAMTDPELFVSNAKNTFENTVIGYDGLVKELNYE